MPEFWSDCSKFVNRHICKIMISLGLGLISSVSLGIGWYVAAQDELDRLTQATDTRSLGNTASIDALTGEVRKIGQVVSDMQGDLKVLKDRSDRATRASYETPPYAAKPE